MYYGLLTNPSYHGGGNSPPLNLVITHTLFVMNKFTIRYFRPYTQDWMLQSFNTIEEAQRMIEFYRSCGSPAYEV